MPNIKGSITGQKKRYTNDFSLTSNGVDQYGDTNFTYSNISDTVDWSISFFINVTNPATGADTFCDGRGGITNNSDGIDLIIIRDTVNGYYFRFRTGTGAGQKDYNFSNADIQKNRLKHIVFNYDSTTRDITLYVDSRKRQSINIGANTIDNSTVSFTRFFAFSGSLVTFFEGETRDYCVFNRRLTQSEINDIYETAVLPVSTHEACDFHVPFNNIALVNGGNREIIDIVEMYNYAKTVNITKNNVTIQGWSDDELGINVGTSTFNAYADYYTKVQGANFSGGGDAIVYKGEELRYYGLQFDSASGHNLTIQGLNTAKTNGYTFLVAVANKSNGAWSAGQSNIFSHIGTEGASRQFVIEGSTSNTGKATKIVFPSGVTTSELESYADNDFDNSKIQFASFALSPNQDYFLTYDKAGNKRGYGQASFNTNVNQANSVNTAFPLSFGFNEITTPTTKIGYNGINSLDGVLCYFAIVEGLENQATIKRQFNNGLLSNPSDFERLGLNLVLFADLNNPFDDAGTIKIPDLGVNNYTIIADSDLDSTWSTLAGVQSSQVDLKTLL